MLAYEGQIIPQHYAFLISVSDWDIGFSHSLLRRYDLGERTPEDATLHKLARYYRVEFVALKFKQFDDWYPPQSENRLLISQWLTEQGDL